MDPAQTLWEACGRRMRQLHHAAQYLQSHQATKGSRVLLSRVLSVMKVFRVYVNDSIILPHDIIAQNKRHCELAHVVDQLLLVVERCTEWCKPNAEEIEYTRAQDFRIEEAVAMETSGHPCEMNDQPKPLLVSVIRAIRLLEQNRAFHRDLLLAIKNMTLESEYSIDNFAYGHTPLDSWARVCSQHAVVNLFHVEDSLASVPATSASTTKMDDDGSAVQLITTPCVVFGSSTGSLVFFTSLLLSQPCTGVEILPFLHTTAQRIQTSLHIKACSFLCTDMLQTRLIGTRLLVLTSQCWDDDLYRHVVRKVENELAFGALVIDYRNGLTHSRHFRLRDRVSDVRVSWNHAQTLYCFEHIG